MVFASLGIVHFVSAPIDPGEFEQFQQPAGHRARRHAAEECEGKLLRSHDHRLGQRPRRSVGKDACECGQTARDEDRNDGDNDPLG